MASPPDAPRQAAPVLPFGGFPGRAIEGMPESLRNAPPPEPPPDFGAYRRAAATAPTNGQHADPFMDDVEEEPPPGEDPNDWDLRSFLSQWNYAPGLSYIAIKRLSPANVRGFATSGFLEEIHEPIEEAWLGARWGGGTFVLDIFAYNERSGRAGRIDSRTVSIGGSPTHYRGPSGEPAPIPGIVGAGAPPPGAWPNASAPSGYPPSGYPNNYPPNGGRPQNAWDASQGVAARRAEDVNVIRMTQEGFERAAKQQTDGMKVQNDALREDLAALRREAAEARSKQGDVAASMLAPIQSTVDSVREQLSQQQRAHSDQQAQMRTQHDAELRAQRESFERMLGEIRNQHERQLDAARMERSESLADLRERHKSEQDALRDQLRMADERARRDIDAAKETLAARYEAQLLQRADEVKRLERDEDRARTEAKTREDDLKKELEAMRTLKSRGITGDLTELAGVAQALKTVGGAFGMVPAGEGGGEEVPKDTLGKILHYMPGIQQATAPLLQRVDNMADAIRNRGAQAAAAQQQAIAAQQAAMYPMAAPHQQGMLPAPGDYPIYSQPGGGQPGPIQPLQPQPQQPIQLQPAQPQPVQQPQTPPGGPSQGQDTQIFQYLQARFEADADAVTVAGEVKMALPAEQLAMLKAATPDQVVSEVLEAAGPGSSLATPRGRAWLAQIHAVVKASA